METAAAVVKNCVQAFRVQQMSLKSILSALFHINVFFGGSHCSVPSFKSRGLSKAVAGLKGAAQSVTTTRGGLGGDTALQVVLGFSSACGALPCLVLKQIQPSKPTAPGT